MWIGLVCFTEVGFSDSGLAVRWCVDRRSNRSKVEGKLTVGLPKARWSDHREGSAVRWARRDRSGTNSVFGSWLDRRLVLWLDRHLVRGWIDVWFAHWTGVWFVDRRLVCSLDRRLVRGSFFLSLALSFGLLSSFFLWLSLSFAHGRKWFEGKMNL